MAPVPLGSLLASIEDALAHIAVCEPFDTALVLWESAAKAVAAGLHLAR